VTSVSRSLRLMGAQAMLLLVPAGLSIEAELAAEQLSLRSAEQKASLAEAQSVLRRRPISCAPTADRTKFLTREEIVHQVEAVHLSTVKVGVFPESSHLTWAERHGLPFTGGALALHEAALELYYDKTRLPFAFCGRHGGDGPEDDAQDDVTAGDAALRDEEAASLRWLDQMLAVLERHDRAIAAARAAFESDRRGLLVLSWVLRMTQAIGWGLNVFVILPRDYRAWRTKRAGRPNPGASPPADQ
jgi:hypothetical protein